MGCDGNYTQKKIFSIFWSCENVLQDEQIITSVGLKTIKTTLTLTLRRWVSKIGTLKNSLRYEFSKLQGTT